MLPPIYETFEGWESQLSDITTYSHLPPKAQRYVEGLAHLTGTPIWIVSLGPRRDQTIVVS
ncbi:MAG: adenylosuccinate synthetase [Ignavibacteria bacterium]|nr:adenylosuccinate synthetase [Ignavibacteria bacterium]